MTRHVLAFAFVFTLFCACKKEKKPSTPSPSVKGTVEGSSWTATTFSATYMYGVFLLTAKASDGSIVILRVKPFAGNEAAAPYVLPYNSDDNVGIYMAKENDPAYATNQFDGSKPMPGILTFTKFNTGAKKVSGKVEMEVKRILDGKTRKIVLTFEEITYDDKVPPTPGKTMTCKVDGVSWTAASVNAIYSSLLKTVSVVGNATNGSTVSITVPYKAGVGANSVTEFGEYRAQYNPTVSSFLLGKSGTINITEHNTDAKIIKGTFDFSASDGTTTRIITAGSFVGVYQ